MIFVRRDREVLLNAYKIFDCEGGLASDAFSMSFAPLTEHSLLPFFEHSPDFLCIAGFDGFFKRINPSVSRVLGYTEEELMARRINEFVHPDDRELTQRHRENLWNGKPLLNFENRYVTREGSIVWLSWNSIPRPQEELVYAIAKDVTAAKEQEARRNQLITELAKTNEELKQLSYTTSHNIRSPIGNLLTVFGMFDPDRITDPDTLDLLELLQMTGEQLKTTMDRYLNDLQESEAVPGGVVEIDIRETLASVTGSIGALIRDSKLAIELDLEAFQTVEFNASYLESVFLNLITNSIKYAHPDRDPEVKIQAQVFEKWKRIVYSDNGIGFDSEKHKDKVFGMRQSFHNHPDSKGIGLYLVYNHITSLGGRINVHSRVNEGATFVIDFKV